jgi:Ser/Thr protein kinase RdoA (MazF antagonist)
VRESALSRIRAGFGLTGTAAAEFVGRGAMGRVWRLTTPEGRFAVKESIWGGGWPAVAAEVRFRDAAVAAGVSAPVNVPTVSGDPVLTLSTRTQVRLYSWVEGTDLADAAARRAAAPWLGETLARLHALRMPADRPVDPWYERVPTEADWLALGRPAVAPHAERIAALSALVHPAPRDSLVLCHLDLAPVNVLRTDAGRVLLDWDDVGPAAADRELASALLRWFPDDRAAVARTLAAYRAHGGPARLNGGSVAMRVATGLNFVHAQASVALDTALPEADREFGARALAAELASLPDEAAMRELLELSPADPGRSGQLGRW